MHDESLPAMPFPPPSSALLEQAGADALNGRLRSWMYALPKRIQYYLNLWQAEWTGESLRQGYLGYVLPCRRQDGSAAILKLSPDTRGAEEQATALSAWAGDGAVPLLAKSFDENGAALLIGRITPGVALRPLYDPAGQRIARCLQRLGLVLASSVRGSLPTGLERLDTLIAANARHVRSLSPKLRL
ncbi:MAG TPA: aminoglycoside phosphotransferase family protein, partial [Chthoniobacterales bacterium]|nr:aminoglycoside phosphotransferase family protein [Chthoniobacterales bacterium]